MLSGAARASVIEGLTLFAGVVWLWAGLAKLWRPFPRAELATLLPSAVGGYAVLRWAVPVVEVAVGASLVTGVQSRAAGWVGAMLGWTFASLHAVALVRSGLSDAPVTSGCGCFGGRRVSGGPMLVVAPAAPAAPAIPAAPAGAVVDIGAVRSRSWAMARAALLAIATWTAVLPCPFCSG